MNTDSIKRDLLIFNDKAYAELGTPLLPSCSGYYKMKGQEGVLLYERDGALSAFIVDMTTNGARMFAVDDIVMRWLGLTRGGDMAEQAIANKIIVSRERLEWTRQGDQAAETGPDVPAMPPQNDLQVAVAQRDALCAAAHVPYLKPLLQAVEAVTGRPFSMEDEVARPRERMQG